MIVGDQLDTVLNVVDGKFQIEVPTDVADTSAPPCFGLNHTVQLLKSYLSPNDLPAPRGNEALTSAYYLSISLAHGTKMTDLVLFPFR